MSIRQCKSLFVFLLGKGELFTEEEERVDLSNDDEHDNHYEIFTDENFPNQFRVTGNKIERVSLLL